MVNFRGSKTPKKGAVSPGKQVKSPAKTAPKTPAKAAPKTPTKSPVRPQKKTPQAPIAQKTPLSRKRELKQEKPEEESDERLNKKMKQTPRRKSLPAKILLKEELEDSIEEESDEDDELQLNLDPAQVGSDADDDDEDGDEDEDDENDEDEDEDEEEVEDYDEEEVKIGKVEDDDEDVEETDENDEDSDETEELNEQDIKMEQAGSPTPVQAQAKSSQVKKEKKPKDKKPLYETTTILARGIKPTATVKQVKQHFADCGKITSCKITLNKKSKQPSAFVSFNTMTEAKCAEGTKNGKPFQGRNIGVILVKTAHHFTPEDTVVICGLPKAGLLSPHKIYAHVKTEMNTFGEVAYVKFDKHMNTGNVQFKDNTGVAAALKAGHFQLLDARIRICGYGDFQTPETKLTIFGLTDDISESDVESALLNHCPIVNAFFPKNKSDEKVKSQLTVSFKTAEAAEKILAMKTLTVKNTVLDILPHYQSERFFDNVTKVYHRHPAGVFIENLNANLQYQDILADMGKFGPVMRIVKYNRNRCALVIFEQKADAAKALKTSSPTVKNSSVRFHAVDGVYATPEKPALMVGTTVYFANIPDRKHIGEVVKKIKAAKLRYKSVVPNEDLLSRKFKNSIFVDFDTKEEANKALKTKITLGNNQEVKLVLYDPAKHDSNTKNLVLVEGLGDGTKEVDLWKSFQGFGEISTAVVLRSSKSSTGAGYVQFKTGDVVNKALKAKNVEINGYKVRVIKPTSEAMEKLRVKVSDAFKPRFKSNKGNHYKGKGKMGKSPKSPQSYQNKNKMSFKKKTFKKGGVKAPRRSL